MLGSTFKHDQPSLPSYVKTPGQHIEMGTSATVFSEPAERFQLKKGTVSETITTVTAGKGKPLPLSPPLPAFSTYNKTVKKDSLPFDRYQSSPPWEEAESSKTSLRSFEAGWRSAEDGELDAPKHLRNVESREALVEK